MQFEMLHDRVLVSLIAEDRKTPAGLYIPQTGNPYGQMHEGRVVAVGPGEQLHPAGREPTRSEVPVRVGDRVLFDRASGHEVAVDGRSYLIVSARSLHCVLRGVD